MKNSLYLVSIILFLSFTLSVKATNPVPNYSFENWTAGNPVGWNSNNNLDYTCITQTTPGYSSTYAAKGKIGLDAGFYTYPPLLEAIGSGNGFAITENYNNFEFYYKTQFTGGDVFIASVFIEDAGHDTIGIGSDTITAGTSVFAKKDITITYTNGNAAASAIITFSMPDNSRDTISYFIVDSVSLNTVVTGIENVLAESELDIYPNPAINQLTIHTSPFNNEAVTVSVLNVLGQETSPPTLLQRDDAEVDVSKLSAGIYFVQLKSERGSVAKMFVKE